MRSSAPGFGDAGGAESSGQGSASSRRGWQSGPRPGQRRATGAPSPAPSPPTLFLLLTEPRGGSHPHAPEAAAQPTSALLPRSTQSDGGDSGAPSGWPWPWERGFENSARLLHRHGSRTPAAGATGYGLPGGGHLCPDPARHPGAHGPPATAPAWTASPLRVLGGPARVVPVGATASRSGVLCCGLTVTPDALGLRAHAGGGHPGPVPSPCDED